MLEFVDLLFKAGLLVVLCGIFLRLGKAIEAVRGLEDRVGALERWRHNFHPPIITGGRS